MGTRTRLTQLEEEIGRAGDLHLTSAEIRILPFLPTYLSVKEIAERLHLSRATVKTHVSSIYTKLGVASRSEAVDKMEVLGLGTTGAEHAEDPVHEH